MNRRIVGISSLAGLVMLVAGAQLLFKQAGLHASHAAGWLGVLALNPWLWMGLTLSGAGMVCWLLALRVFPLSSAYPWTALIYVITPPAGAWLFNEVLTGRYVLGMVFVLAGVLITSRGVSPR